MKNEAGKISTRQTKAAYWIEKLDLAPHPEGGFFREIYRSDELLTQEALPGRYEGDRAVSTSIYFLLQKEEVSVFHRLKSDETWYFHDGANLEIIVIDAQGKLNRHVLGINGEKDELPQLTIGRDCWFAARTLGAFTLVGCNVAPGFDFRDFEIAELATLNNLFPDHLALLRQFCK